MKSGVLNNVVNQTPMKLILLPGLDGTGQLFTPFLNVLPTHYLPNVINYPADEPLSYAELGTYVQQRLPTDENYVVVAESFSGPIAIQLAARRPPNLKALVLCATFVFNPVPLSLNLSFLLHAVQSVENLRRLVEIACF